MAPERLGLGPEGKWIAPATVEADVFAFGMCILEAVTRRAPWKHLADNDVRAAVTTGLRLPPRPVGLFIDEQWGLLTQICSFDPRRRPNISSVVHQLESFMKSASVGVADKDDACGTCTGADDASSGSSEPVEENSIAYMLGAVQSMVSSVSEYSTMNEQMCARMLDIYSKLHGAASPWSGVLSDNSAKPRQWWIRATQRHIHAARREEAQRFLVPEHRPNGSVDDLCADGAANKRHGALELLAKVLDEFHACLVVAAQEPLNSLAMLCATRTSVAQEVFELHTALDRLIASTPILHTARTVEVHGWEESWEEQRRLQVCVATSREGSSCVKDNSYKGDDAVDAQEE
ncbi:Leucine-rich repeat serine/threonine-protein kinase 2 [Phytophthora pseudosyringae]|uniref:Leucine-rich repeat serine/threonine-protein kinase 2 n=1 Tax=Phytophthora pseudosyringae TaxID=221518 RepID=A0A8T1V827_9STRA|nr:Leucine-rich repeat serine/threonine-protein kinase 2 [Phytophthora pseudosyringae]